MRQSPVSVRIYGLSVTGCCVAADMIQIHTKHQTSVTLTNVRYVIHETISVQSAEVKIGDLSFTLHDIRVTFSSPIQLSFQSVHLDSYVTMRRFDRNEPMQYLWKEPYIIRIPEVRIHKRPSLSMVQRWKHSVERWFPKESNDAPLPIIHVSSVFIRYRSWTRCIAPISTGNKSIWELYEHVVRALMRI